jgi:hypothetical protein
LRCCSATLATRAGSTYLTLKDAVGGLFRVRANYVRSASDSSNSNADSGWFYFKVVK